MDCSSFCLPLINPNGLCPGSCFIKCPDVCRVLVIDDDIYQSVPPPPPPPPYVHGNTHKVNQKHAISTSISVGASLLGTIFFLGVFCIISRAYCYRRQGNQRRRAGSAPTTLGSPGEFWDENHGPQLDHPIWYIHTVGLQQSVIEAITVLKYKKGEGLVEGTECSVCLNEFQDDENLRLLPKCSHAFHLPCIDTWLRSHKNCPVCRAPIVNANFDARVDLMVPLSADLSQIGNSGSGSSGLFSDGEGQDGGHEFRIGDGNTSASEDGSNAGAGGPKSNLHHSNLSDHVQVRSDLLEHGEDVEAATQPMRRSVSLDSTAALAIYTAVSQAVGGRQPGDLDSTKQSKHSRANRVDKRGTTGSLSFRKLMTSSPIGKSLQIGPILMKKSFSSSRKSSSSSSSLGESGRQDSILPL